MLYKISIALVLSVGLVAQTFGQRLYNESSSKYFYYDLRNVGVEVTDIFKVDDPHFQAAMSYLKQLNEHSDTVYNVLYFRYNTKATNSFGPPTKIPSSTDSSQTDEQLKVALVSNGLGLSIRAAKQGRWQDVRPEIQQARKEYQWHMEGLNYDYIPSILARMHKDKSKKYITLVMEDLVVMDLNSVTEASTIDDIQCTLYDRAYIDSNIPDATKWYNQALQNPKYDPNNRNSWLKQMLERATKRKQQSSPQQLLFINGYEPNFHDTTNEPEHLDDISPSQLNWEMTKGEAYWQEIGEKFRERINPERVFYLDGDDNIMTSNHAIGCKLAVDAFTQFNDNFNESICWRLNKAHCKTKQLQLHTQSNDAGFLTRKQHGQQAGEKLVNELKQVPPHSTLHIVAHSMGYAYALGAIEAIKSAKLPLKLGSFYILAPENACSSSALINLSDFEEVFQYGSAERGTPDPDPEYYQDGVAAQCPVKGLEKANKDLPPNLGRAFYPKNKPTQYPRGFINSHRIGHYGWIFDELKKDKDKGYVKER